MEWNQPHALILLRTRWEAKAKSLMRPGKIQGRAVFFVNLYLSNELQSEKMWME
jgi:hypothetical protein